VKGKVCISGLVVVLFASCLASVAFAQASWWRTFGDSLADYGYEVRLTSDSGYVIGGLTASFGAGITDVYLVKTNATGEEVWAGTWGDTMEDGGNSVRQTADSGYIIAGYTGSFGAGGHDVYLIRTNAAGDTAWTRTYGGTRGDAGNSVATTGDGGCIVTGYTWSFGAGNADVYLVKTDAAGDTAWTRAYGGTSGDEGYSVQQTADGGYIVVGVTNSFGAGNADVYLLKTNAAGDTAWTRTYGGTSGDGGYSVQQTADSGYIIAGYTSSFGAGNHDVYLIKTDAAGDTVWTRTYGGNLRDWGNSVQQTAGGGYMITGATRSSGAGAQDVWLLKTDAAGDTAWTRTYGGTGNDEGNSVQPAADGGWVIAGSTTSFGAGGADVYLIKADTNGYVGVAEESFKPQARSRRLEPTVVPSLPQGAVAFDAMGRRALPARPGIYFVRDEPQASSHKPQAVRKFVVAR
jgi:hypothetical protein